MSLLFVNACVRPESRTKILADYVINKFNDDVVEICLEKERIEALDLKTLNYRSALAQNGNFDDPMFEPAKKFAAADTIVIAAPYWDLSFSASLKAFIEAINIVGLTFAYNEQGMPYSMCKAKRLIYVTTAGGPIVSDEFGFGYVKALSQLFYGIENIYYFKAENLDVIGVDVEAVIKEKKEEINKYIY